MTIDEIKKYSNITELNNDKRYNKFNRFRKRLPSEELDGMNFYVFVTKPDCYFYESGSNASTLNSQIKDRYQFYDILNFNPHVLQYLQMNQGGGDIIPCFYNNVESIDVNDRVIKTRDSVETTNDWKTVMGHKMNDSLGANTFNMTLRDNRYKIIYHTLEAWVTYIDLITKGFIKPTDYNRDNKILDYGCSVYYIVTAEDGVSILYYCKYVNVFPLNIPDSAFSSSNKALDYNIQFQYSYRDPTPACIVDFNTINYHNKGIQYAKTYEDGVSGSTWVSGFYIETTTDGYKLRAVK